MRLLNWLNRAIVVLVLLATVLVALATAASPAWVGGIIRAQAQRLEVDPFSSDRLVISGVALAVALLTLGLLLLELRLRSPVAVALAGDETARLETGTVVQRIRAEVERVPDVLQARPLVTPRRGAVDIELAVDTVAEIDVPAKAAEVRSVAQAEVERLGLKLGRLQVRLSQPRTGLLAPPPERSADQ